MLVLTRKVGEGIAIGDDVKIVVMQIKGKQVRLGIKASPQTTVHREEIYQKIQEENVKASAPQVSSLDEAATLFRPEGSTPARTPLRRQIRDKKLGEEN